MSLTAPDEKAFLEGTHRAVAPSETWARVAPHLPTVGVTRVADLTGLDRVGIPVMAAVRPRGEILQAANGKGVGAMQARVSAVMEALEHWHCEREPPRAVSAAIAELDPDERTPVPPAHLPLVLPDRLGGPRRRLGWVPGTELGESRPVWLPAAAVHANALPRCFTFSANGLASGNTLVEATLHALYEVVERDAVTRRIRCGFTLRPPAAERVREDTVVDAAVAGLFQRIRTAGLSASLVLLRHGTPIPVFWAALLDPSPFHPCTRVTFGYGAHLSPGVAAARALSEAAQARLSFIHGLREDLGQRIRTATEELVRPVHDYFDRLVPTLDWRDLEDTAGATLETDLAKLLGLLWEAGAGAVYRAELTRPEIGIPVVKVLVPGKVVDRRFF